MVNRTKKKAVKKVVVKKPAKKAVVKKEVEVKSLKLDLGCGKNAREGFVGVDQIDFGQPIVADLRQKWPWEDNSVDEVHCSHFIEHLTGEQRIHFVNELYRVLKPEGKALMIAPHWASARAYGDMTHQWPPVCEFWFLYMNKGWRDVNAPHSGYNDNVHFEIGYNYNYRPDVADRGQDYVNYAVANYKEVAQDIVSFWTKKEWPSNQ
jgi:ubiquinone/menaquinone biosynthesis C-methylase UbiE